MSVLFGAVVCGLFLVSIFLLFTLPVALAWGWLGVKSVLVVGKGFDVSEAKDQEELPEVCERPYIDLLDPLAVYPQPLNEDAARIERVRKAMLQKNIPTLPGKGPTSYVPIRAYKDKTEITQNHTLEILNR